MLYNIYTTTILYFYSFMLIASVSGKGGLYDQKFSKNEAAFNSYVCGLTLMFLD